MAGNVVSLDTARAAREGTNIVKREQRASLAAARDGSKAHAPAPHASMHAISALDSQLLMTLYRRFYRETDQLVGFMEKLGIGSPAARQFRKDVHIIKNEILAVRVLRNKTE